MTIVRSWITASFLGAALAACSAAPDQPTGSSQEALRPRCVDGECFGGLGGTRSVPSEAETCPNVNSGVCTTTDLTWSDFSDVQPLIDAGCWAPIQWKAPIGLIGEDLTLCPSSGAVRAWVDAHPGSALVAACDACIGAAGPGSVWVRIEKFALTCGVNNVGKNNHGGGWCSPYCPSGCGVVSW